MANRADLGKGNLKEYNHKAEMAVNVVVP